MRPSAHRSMGLSLSVLMGADTVNVASQLIVLGEANSTPVQVDLYVHDSLPTASAFTLILLVSESYVHMDDGDIDMLGFPTVCIAVPLTTSNESPGYTVLACPDGAVHTGIGRIFIGRLALHVTEGCVYLGSFVVHVTV